MSDGLIKHGFILIFLALVTGFEFRRPKASGLHYLRTRSVC